LNAYAIEAPFQAERFREDSSGALWAKGYSEPGSQDAGESFSKALEAMLKVKQHGPVTVFKMGRHVGKTILYPVHAFLMDETLIDSGTRRVGQAFSAEMEKRKITTLINTHHHEDHIGNNRLLQDRFGVTVLAHPSARIWPDAPAYGCKGCLYRVRFDSRSRAPFWKRPFRRQGIYRKAIQGLLDSNQRTQEKYDEVKKLASELEAANRQLIESKEQLESKGRRFRGLGA
jgi:hypothetical protein